MCGILSYIGTFNNLTIEQLIELFKNTYKRGPDSTEMKQITNNLCFGFHRLSINDITYRGNQPLHHPKKPFYLICNGEIYNHKSLLSSIDVTPYSNSDCEVILYLYEHYGIEKTLQLLDSESYAFCLYDGLTNKMYLARDRYGVRPMFIGVLNPDDKYKTEYIIASELKSISGAFDQSRNDYVYQFPSGNYCVIELSASFSPFSHIEMNKPIEYFNKSFDLYCPEFELYDIDIICQQIKHYFTQAVKKRLLSDVPIGCLLSGGLDSSLVSALVQKHLPEQINTFAIGITGSTDLHYAQLVAKHINSKHHQIELTEKDFLDAIEEVIYAIESYDTTSVRASVGNYLVGKYIKQNTNVKVVFNGDGSDEQSGYIYLANAPSPEEFKQECIRLLSEIQYFDVLRSDRSLSSQWSLETRSPFLDTDFVNYYMSIPAELKMYGEKHDNKIEKYMLRKAFENTNLLPDEVLWRRKEAFSDGCSSKERSWHKVIQEFVDSQVSDEEFNEHKNDFIHNTPMLKESYYYRKIFEKYYPTKTEAELIPHFWLPKWQAKAMHDPSARELNNY